MANLKKLTLPANIVLLSALILSLLVTISLPLLSPFDITRVVSRIEGGRVPDLPDIPEIDFYEEFRFGVWAMCGWTPKGDKKCRYRGLGYEVPVGFDISDPKDPKTITITKAWTRGLGIHPVVTGAEGLALAASLTTMHTINLLAPLVCLLAAAITLIAFAIDIALHVHVIVIIKKIPIPDGFTHPKVSAGPGFWITFVVLLLNIVAAGVLFIARRRELRGESAYPALSTQFQAKGFFSRFRK